MSSYKLKNYLRSYRRRSGLTQKEVAFLLGCNSESKISRYENSVQLPNLKTVLALEVLYQIPPQNLFAGIYETEKQAMIQNAEQLVVRLNQSPPDQATMRKLSVLNAICGHADDFGGQKS